MYKILFSNASTISYYLTDCKLLMFNIVLLSTADVQSKGVLFLQIFSHFTSHSCSVQLSGHVHLSEHSPAAEFSIFCSCVCFHWRVPDLITLLATIFLMKGLLLIQFVISTQLGFLNYVEMHM